MTQHTPGVIRAAEILTGGKYDQLNGKTYPTEYGNKTVRGIADIIANETAAPKLLEALKYAESLNRRGRHLDAQWLSRAQAAIAKATL